MNKLLLLIFMLSAATLCGCRTRYELTLTNTTHVTAASRPKLVNGWYVFKDVTGRTNQISQSRVIQIEAKGPWDKSGDDFGSRKKR